MPPSAIVSVPVPKLPIFTPELLLQREPAPVTVTVPCEPARVPMLVTMGVISMTLPPFAIMSVPVPKLPMLSPPLGPLIQVEPGPVTVTVPIEPADNPTEPPYCSLVFSRAAVLNRKGARALAADHDSSTFVQLEPEPVTVTVPTPPGRLPTVPK